MRGALFATFFAFSAPAQAKSFDPALLHQIDRTIELAIAQQKLPGGVIHLERDGVIYERAYGKRALVPAIEPMTADTIFDAASITKVVATAPSIWLLIQRGKIGLDDPVQRYIPEFRHADITVRHLLTHTSGLRPDLDLDRPWSGYQTAIALAVAEEPGNRPGIVFRYSDINFELLGEIVQRVSGESLDVFARREIFDPLKMKDTGFRPLSPRRGEKDSESLAPRSGERVPEGRVRGRIAPTEFADGQLLRGVVHDPTARRMGGVAGHAGLFITARDLARYCRMLLRGGAPLFTPEIVKMLTSVQSPPGVAVQRAGGFDVDSPFSRPRGDVFPIGSFGHTGFTGGFFWVDPPSRTFYLFLSNRVHPNGSGNVLRLQYDLGSLAGRAAGYAVPTTPRVRVVFDTGANTNNGVDHLAAQHYTPLRGVKIGLLTNTAAIDRNWNPTMDLLRSAPGVELVALFSPEHGMRAAADEKVADSRDPLTGLPVYSLYSDTKKPKPEQLAGIDAVVFDLQDVGVRFYTYINAMREAMKAAAEGKKKFIVLDRVNPIGGEEVEGPLLHDEMADIAWHDVPIRHGMTAGELAQMLRAEQHIDVDLTIIPLQRWRRELWQDDAGLPWSNPSPNMRSLTAASLYPGVGILEFAIAVGRGTPTPFELAGAPYVDAASMAADLTSLGLAGVRFEPVHFTPSTRIFAGMLCHGVRFVVTDRRALKPVALGIAVASVLHRRYPSQFALDKLQVLLRDPRTLDAIRADRPLGEIVAGWAEEERAFRARRGKYLLY